MIDKLPISAFIVSKDEGNLLENCLKTVLFCDQIIVINLESTDDTVAIAEKYGAKVFTIKTIPIIEMIYFEYIKLCKHNWILLTDPDECAMPALKVDIENLLFSSIDTTKIGYINVPIVYFFKSHRLKGTSWGGVKSRTYIVHKERFTFKPNVHNGGDFNEGFQRYEIKHNGNNHINHYWMQGYRQIFEKHLRYLKNEGESKYKSGYRTSISLIIKIPFRQFINSFVYARGFKDGFIGVFLSVFRAWYFTAANIELYKHQKKNKH